MKYPPAIIFAILLFIACNTQSQSTKSPRGYDLNRPVKYNMPEDLLEISGIAFNNGDPNVLYAEQDEKGSVYALKPGSYNVQKTKFGKSGDYEDIAISNNRVIMLRSDGTLYTFPFTDLKSPETNNIKEQSGLLPEGEYEGMYADGQSVYVLCKHCSIEKTTKETTIFSLSLSADGTLTKSGQNTIDVKQIEKLTGTKKIAFHPSALTKNKLTNQWYILSSVNKLLVITDNNWMVEEVYPLNPAIFGQPEGMAFDKDGNLYISNEGSKLSPGNVLKFVLKK